MGKLLVIVVGLLFASGLPLTADENKTSLNQLVFAGQARASDSEHAFLSRDTLLDGIMSTSGQTLGQRGDSDPIDGNLDVEGWANTSILYGDAGTVSFRPADKDSGSWHEAVSHHLDASTGLVTGNARQNDTQGGEKHAKGREIPDQRVQVVRIERNPVTVTDGRCIGPLCAEVGFLESVSLFVAAAAVFYGTLFSIGVLCFFKPVITRWWYVDFLLGEIVALAGFVWMHEVYLWGYPG